MACIYIYGEEEARKKASSEFSNEKAKSIDDFRKVIEGKRRTEAGESMPGNALFLVNITY